MTWVNAGAATVQAEVDVWKPPSAPARTLELFVYPHGGASLLPTNTNATDSVYGHPAANGVIAVAAIDATDPMGTRLEPYSSRGPVTIMAPLAATRQKPDCSGVDGVRVTGAGSFSTVSGGRARLRPTRPGSRPWSGRGGRTRPGPRSGAPSSARPTTSAPSGPIRPTARAG